MKVKCEYCGSFMLDTEEFCPACGASNESLMRSGDGIPKTIEELKIYVAAKGLPLEQMRFFIGEDIKEPKAFGIYKDVSGNFIVYKNKANGERAVRYRGTDEAYAVNELYQKLRSEVTDQKARIAAEEEMPENQQNKSPKKRKKGKILLIVAACFIVSIISSLFLAGTFPDNGYYLYQDTYYYTQDLGETWYKYDVAADDWVAIPSVDKELSDSWKTYKIADSEQEETQTTNTEQMMYAYPIIRDSHYWNQYDTEDSYYDDSYDDTDASSYDDAEDANSIHNTEATDTWDDDWDDDDLDWDDSYDWDDSSTDWDSEW